MFKNVFLIFHCPVKFELAWTPSLYIARRIEESENDGNEKFSKL